MINHQSLCVPFNEFQDQDISGSMAYLRPASKQSWVPFRPDSDTQPVLATSIFISLRTLLLGVPPLADSFRCVCPCSLKLGLRKFLGAASRCCCQIDPISHGQNFRIEVLTANPLPIDFNFHHHALWSVPCRSQMVTVPQRVNTLLISSQNHLQHSSTTSRWWTETNIPSHASQAWSIAFDDDFGHWSRPWYSVRCTKMVAI